MKNFIKGFMLANVLWWIIGTCAVVDENHKLRKDLDEALGRQSQPSYRNYKHRKGAAIKYNKPDNPIGFC